MLVQLGFIAGHQPVGAAEALHTLMRNGRSRGHSINIVSLDVEKAFGETEAWAVELAIQDYDARAKSIAAVLRELVDQHVVLAVAGVACATVGKKATRRGAPGTPTMWKYVVRAFTRPLINSWEGDAPVKWCPARVPLPLNGKPTTPILSQNVPRVAESWLRVGTFRRPSTGHRSARTYLSICARTAAMRTSPWMMRLMMMMMMMVGVLSRSRA